jgi:hypothetical protein
MQCAGIGGLTAHINTGSDTTVLTASAALSTETATVHWTGGHCADTASRFGRTSWFHHHDIRAFVLLVVLRGATFRDNLSVPS